MRLIVCLAKAVIPPAMLGRRPKFDLIGESIETLELVSRQSTTRMEQPDRRTEDVKSLKVGVQISCCFYTEIQKKKSVQRAKTKTRTGVPRVGETQRV